MILGVLTRIHQDGVCLLLVATFGQTGLVSRSSVYPGRLFLGNSNQEGPPDPFLGVNLSIPTRDMESLGLAPEGYLLIYSGLSTEVVDTIPP